MSLTRSAILEIHDLSNRAEVLARGGAADRKQSDILMQRIASIKTVGLSTDEVRAEYALGLVESLIPGKEQRDAEYLRRFHAYIKGDTKQIETRDLEAGTQSITYTAGTSGGYLVPFTYGADVWTALAQTDPVLNSNVSNFTTTPTPTLLPKQISGYDLSTISASLIGEGVQQLAGGIPTVNGRVLRSNLIYKLSLAATIEAETDIPDTMGKMAQAMGVGFARKLGQDAMLGNGSSTQPLGLLTSLTNYPAAHTTGSGVITYTDILDTFFGLNPVYRNMPGTSWLCADSTYQRIRAAVDNNGRPLLDIQDDKQLLMGKPLYVSPSCNSTTLSSLGFGALVFGNIGGHFFIRCSQPTLVRAAQQSTSDVTKGEALFIARIRMDSALFDPSNGAAPPIIWTAVTT